MGVDEARPERDTAKRVCLLLSSLLEKGELTYEEAACAMGLKPGAHRAEEIVRHCADHLPALERGKRGRLVVVRLRGVSRFEPTLHLAVAASFGASLSALFEGTPYAKGMSDALDTIVRASPNPQRFDQIGRRFLFMPRGGESRLPDRARVLEQVVKAVLERKRIKFRYHPSWGSQRARTETANPWAIVIHNQWLYVVGHSMREAKPWLWRFGRMDDVRPVRGRPFPPPTATQFDPKTFFRGSFGIVRQPDEPIRKVELALAPHWAPYARSHSWHPSQSIGNLPDGRTRLTLEVRICPELVAWVLGFGGDAEVIRPAKLRNRIRAELIRASAVYTATESGLIA